MNLDKYSLFVWLFVNLNRNINLSLFTPDRQVSECRDPLVNSENMHWRKLCYRIELWKKRLFWFVVIKCDDIYKKKGIFKLNSLIEHFRSTVLFVLASKIENIITCRKWLPKVMKFLSVNETCFHSFFLKKKSNSKHKNMGLNSKYTYTIFTGKSSASQG